MEYKCMETLVNGLEKFHVKLSEKQLGQLVKYYDMLVEKNKVMNLTAITEWEEVVVKHFLDSLAIAVVLDLKSISSVIDVGTGAGFPGIVLKIAFPYLKITLLDSLNKRVKFLNEVIQTLELEDISAIHGRAEEVGRTTAHREKYDLCVSRAVANLSTLAEYCVPFIKVGGIFCSYKGSNGMEEVEQAEHAITLLNSKIIDVNQIQLPESDIQRIFVQIQKEKPLSKRYPRKAGLPAKEPLC